MDISDNKIIIVGAGAAGTVFFANLVDKLISYGNNFGNVTIKIIESTGIFGPGIAYSTKYSCNLMNSPSTDLGIIQGNKSHFWTWVLKNEYELLKIFPELINFNANTALPRALYGLYLKHVFDITVKKAIKSGINIVLIKDFVFNIIRYKGEYKLFLKNNKILLTNTICCCCGLGKKHQFPNFLKKKNYLSFPGIKEEKKIMSIPSDKDVIILGTRLSAIDCILMLKKNLHKGKIFLVSRTGGMPNVISKHTKLTCKFLNEDTLLSITNQGTRKLSLQQLLSLIEKEYKYHEKKPIQINNLLLSKRAPFVNLRYNLIKTNDKIRLWQAALYSTNNVVDLAWQLLSYEGKQQFIKEYMGFFKSYRIAMPRQNAEKIYSLYRKKQLFAYSGMKNIKYINKKYYIFCDTSDNQPVISEYVIDATGLISQAINTASPLIKNMVENGLVTIDVFNSIKIYPKTLQAINKNGEKENIYFLGGLIQSSYIGASLMESIVTLSNKIVKNLIRTTIQK